LVRHLQEDWDGTLLEVKIHDVSFVGVLGLVREAPGVTLVLGSWWTASLLIRALL